MAYFHKINMFHNNGGYKINIDKVQAVYLNKDNDSAALLIKYDNGDLDNLVEGVTIESAEKEFNRFPC